MTGTTEHQDENAEQNTSSDENVGNINQPLGQTQHMSKDQLKQAADEILAAQPRKSSVDGAADDNAADNEDVDFADPLVSLVNDLKVVHAEKEAMQNQLLLLAADMENLRKRTRREVADAREFAIASFARDVLSVNDNLRRAIETVSPPEPGEGNVEKSTEMNNLIEGVSMTERELLSTLEKHKVKKMTPKGEKFDPNFHQAMFEVPNTEIPNNTVIEVVQDGYVIGERMLRPAMVGVSKGGPKSGKATSLDPDDTDAP